jgi:hypothetical protein
VENRNEDTTSLPVEEVFVSFGLGQLLELAKQFPQYSQGNYFVPVRSMFKCSGCSGPIARLRLGREIRVCNCSYEYSRWVADLLSPHECSGVCQ